MMFWGGGLAPMYAGASHLSPTALHFLSASGLCHRRRRLAIAGTFATVTEAPHKRGATFENHILVNKTLDESMKPGILCHVNDEIIKIQLHIKSDVRLKYVFFRSVVLT